MTKNVQQAWDSDFWVSATNAVFNLNSATWANGVATFGGAGTHDFSPGQSVVIAAVTVASGPNWNGTYKILDVPTTGSLTCFIQNAPSTATGFGTATQSTTLTLDGAWGDYFVINLKTDNAFTINGIANPIGGQLYTIEAKNNIGGNLNTAFTFGGNFHALTAAFPTVVFANTKLQTVSFRYDRTYTQLSEVARTVVF